MLSFSEPNKPDMPSKLLKVKYQKPRLRWLAWNDYIPPPPKNLSFQEFAQSRAPFGLLYGSHEQHHKDFSQILIVSSIYNDELANEFCMTNVAVKNCVDAIYQDYVIADACFPPMRYFVHVQRSPYAGLQSS